MAQRLVPAAEGRVVKGVDRRAVLGLAVAVGAGALAACSPDSQPTTTESAPSISDPPPDAAMPDTAPPASGGLQVVESGWSHEAKENGRVRSYGVIVENTSDRVAFQTTAEVRFIDAAGNDAMDPSGSFLDGRVTVVRPGERIGFGATFLADGDAATKMEVALTTAEWWAEDNTALEFAAITVGDVATDRSHPPKQLMFAVTSGYTENLTSTRAAAVFRNADGKIVGGATAPGPSPLPSGRSEGSITVEYGIPLSADPATIEVYVPVLT